MSDQQEDIKDQLKRELDELDKLTLQDLIRTDVLGKTYDFSQGATVFENILKLFRDIKDLNLEYFPHQTIQHLKNYASTSNKEFSKIKDFDPVNQQNAIINRDNLIKGIENTYNALFNMAVPLLAYNNSQQFKSKKFEEEASKIVDDMKEKSNEMQDILKKARDASAEVGVSQHASHFMDEAKNHLDKCKLWLIATFIIGILTIGIGIFFLLSPIRNNQLSTAQVIQMAVSKLIIFSIFYYGLIWSSRIYKSHWHNYVINRHRQNALKTFETFVKASSDDQTKNAVLLQTTQSIFAPQISGFIQQDAESSNTPKILEIIRDMTSSKN